MPWPSNSEDQWLIGALAASGGLGASDDQCARFIPQEFCPGRLVLQVSGLLTERELRAGLGGMPAQLVADLIGRAREEVSARANRNRFVDALEAGRVPRERLGWLAGEQFRIVGSDQRSFALLAARFPQPPAGEMFLSLAQGELHALRLLPDFAAALGWGEHQLRAYEPQPLAQAYPAYLAWSALFGTSSGVALAMLANLQEWGGYCGRVAEALLTRYDLAEPAVGFFRLFAAPPPGFAEQATSVIAAGLAAGEDPQEAARAARALHTYETAFWDALADGLSLVSTLPLQRLKRGGLSAARPRDRGG